MHPRARMLSAAVATALLIGAGCGSSKPGPAPAATATGGAVAAGRSVFIEQRCGACHTLGPAGTHGTIGPNLAEGLAGKPRSFIRDSIVDPNAVITSGYPANTMPRNFGDKLDRRQLDALVDFLAASSVNKRD